MRPEVLVPLVPLLPLAAAPFLALGGRSCDRDARFVSTLACASALAGTALLGVFLAVAGPRGGFSVALGPWIEPAAFRVEAAFAFGPLAAVLGAAAAGIGTLAGLWPARRGGLPDHAGRFAALDLLTGSALLYLLADDPVLRFAGFAGAGLGAWLLAALRGGEGGTAPAPLLPAGFRRAAGLVWTVFHGLAVALWLAADVVLIDGLFVNGAGLLAKTLGGGFRRLRFRSLELGVIGILLELSAALGYFLLR
jgi:hypothetical protein